MLFKQRIVLQRFKTARTNQVDEALCVSRTGELFNFSIIFICHTAD